MKKNITIAFVALMIVTGAFFAGFASNHNKVVEYKTKTVTKIDPVQNCIVGALKKYGTTDEVIAECEDLTEAQKNQAAAVTEGFVTALFAEDAFADAFAG